MNIDEIAQYYKDNSDLSFELEICTELRKKGCTVEHSGRYADYLTQRFREYDILANPPCLYIDGGHERHVFSKVEFAIECKNISQSCPLIVGTRKERSEPVEFIEITQPSGSIYYSSAMRQMNVALMPRFISHFGQHFIEDIGIEPIQVAREKSGILKAGDRSSTYDKWSQAVSHTIIRCQNTVSEFERLRGEVPYQYWCAPILVVPDGVLYCYADHESEKVRAINGIIMKVNCPFEISKETHESARISNYFLFTKSGLAKFISMFTR
jgi:hypothetical protein